MITYVHMHFCCLIIDKKILYVAYKSDHGYVNRGFDVKLGYMYDFIIDGGYIYAARVRNVLLCTYSN